MVIKKLLPFSEILIMQIQLQCLLQQLSPHACLFWKRAFSISWFSLLHWSVSVLLAILKEKMLLITYFIIIELLRRCAENCLRDMVQMLFTRLPSFVEDNRKTYTIQVTSYYAIKFLNILIVICYVLWCFGSSIKVLNYYYFPAAKT